MKLMRHIRSMTDTDRLFVRKKSFAGVLHNYPLQSGLAEVNKLISNVHCCRPWRRAHRISKHRRDEMM
jgi:hypothetical protein